MLPPKFVRNGCHSALVQIAPVIGSTLLLRLCLNILWFLIWRGFFNLCTCTSIEATSDMLRSKKLVDFIETKRNKMLRNIETR